MKVLKRITTSQMLYTNSLEWDGSRTLGEATDKNIAEQRTGIR